MFPSASSRPAVLLRYLSMFQSSLLFIEDVLQTLDLNAMSKLFANRGMHSIVLGSFIVCEPS